MIRDVYLYGAAGRTFGRHFRLDVASPREAVRALICLRPGLLQILRAGIWRVIVGPPHLANAVEVPALAMNLGAQPVHIVPATPPRGNDGTVGKIVAGVVLVGAAIITAGAAVGFEAGFAAAMATPIGFMGMTYGGIAMMGVSMIVAGVMGVLSTPVGQTEQATDRASPNDQPSFLFNGVTNNSQQGGPVPLVYGEHLVGSVVIGSALQNQDIPA